MSAQSVGTPKLFMSRCKWFWITALAHLFPSQSALCFTLWSSIASCTPAKAAFSGGLTNLRPHSVGQAVLDARLANCPAERLLTGPLQFAKPNSYHVGMSRNGLISPWNCLLLKGPPQTLGSPQSISTDSPGINMWLSSLLGGNSWGVMNHDKGSQYLYKIRGFHSVLLLHFLIWCSSIIVFLV